MNCFFQKQVVMRLIFDRLQIGTRVAPLKDWQRCFQGATMLKDCVTVRQSRSWPARNLTQELDEKRRSLKVPPQIAFKLFGTYTVAVANPNCPAGLLEVTA